MKAQNPTKRLTGYASGVFAGLMALSIPATLHAQSGNNDLAANTDAPTTLRTSYNATAANDDGKTYTVTPDPDEKGYPYTVKYCKLDEGPHDVGVSEAVDYSYEEKEFVIFLRRGRDAKRTAGQYCKLIKDKIFFGENDIPITFLIGKEGEGVNPLMNVIIDGDWEAVDGDDLFLPSELAENASLFVKKYWENRGGKPESVASSNANFSPQAN